MKKLLALLYSIILLNTAISCTTLKIGIEMLKSELDGDALIMNEPNVLNQLEIILRNPEDYTMTGFTRKVFSPELERTTHRYHSFYSIKVKNKTTFLLSFTGTKKWFYSIGVWAINTSSDSRSYESYINGNNEWDVQEIYSANGINTEMTIRNVINMINDDVTYYYNDHRYDKPGMENCNSALLTTIVFN